MSLSKYVSLAALLILVISCTQRKDLSPPSHSEEKEKKAEGRSEFEFMRIKDLKTNEIPIERLMTARKVAKRKLRQKDAIDNINWVERGPNNVAGRTRAIIVDKNDASGNTIWAGAVAGGLWKSTDAGTTWSNIDDFFSNIAIVSLVQDPSNYNVMYFGTGEGLGGIDAVRGLGIWKTSNGGASWSQLPATDNNENFDYVNKLVVDADGVLYAATGSRYCNAGGIMVSSDGGSNFSKFADPDHCGNTAGPAYHGNECTDVEVATNGHIYAAFGQYGDNDGIYKSINSGTSWSLVYTSESNESRIELATAPSDSDVIYALIENTDSGGVPKIKKSTDGGVSWVSKATPSFNDCGTIRSDWTRGQDWYDLICAVDPNNSDRVLIGGVDMFSSSNGGNSWTQESLWCGGPSYMHADQHAMVYDGSSKVWFGNDGGVYFSPDGGANFEFKGNGYNVTQYYAADIHPTAGSNQMLGGTQDNGSHLFNSAGMNSVTTVTGGDGAFCHIDQDNPQMQITSYVYNNYFVTTNGWSSFTEFSQSDNGLFINPTDYDDQSNLLYTSLLPGQIGRWNDPAVAGTSFDAVALSGVFDEITAVRVSPNVNNRVYIGTRFGKVYRIDGAHAGVVKTPTLLHTHPSNAYVSCIEIFDGDENHIAYTVSNYGANSVYHTTNGNAGSPTFTSVEGDLPDMPVRWAQFHPVEKDQIFLATELGVWSTNNINGGSTSWSPTNSGLANTRCDMIKCRKSDNTLIVGSHGRGIFTATIVTPSLCDYDARTIMTGDITTDNQVFNETRNMTIEANINNDGVIFSAEESILFANGFEVQLGKSMTTKIEVCPD